MLINRRRWSEYISIEVSRCADASNDVLCIGLHESLANY